LPVTGRYETIFVVPSDEFHTREEVEHLNSEIETARAAARDAIAAAGEVGRRLETEVGDRETWQNLAIEAEREKARLLTELLALQEQLQEARGPAPAASAIPPSERASKLSEEPPAYFEDRPVPRISRSTDAFVLSGADRVSSLQKSFNVRLKKLQAKFRSMSIDERRKLSKLASLAAKFID
jgi:hypothetical protein